ncbi:histidinol dehydrogenase [soil metagenome]
MTSGINVLELSKLTRAERARCLRRTEGDLAPFLEKVRPIIGAVRSEGDAALIRFAREFDRAEISEKGLAASAEDFVRARDSLDSDVVAAIAFAAKNIRKFHTVQKPQEMWLQEIAPGAFTGERYNPIPSVACYIPRGKGAFPSSVIMTCIPARIAGVEDIIIVTPPGPDGHIDAATLVAAEAAGIDRVYKSGGAQAVAAVAYGTETIPKCVKIVGPGSPWVVAAKRLLSDILDPGPPAGPSETIIFADGTIDGRLAALDLLIEAEHGADSSAWLVTTSAAVVASALEAIPRYWKDMSDQRVAFSRAVLSGERGGIILAPDIESAIGFINDYAPEHLEILTLEPFSYLGRIVNAGEILLGAHTPTTLGNFVLGPSHVLPTGGWAKSYSPLSVFDFMKRTSIGYVTRDAYPALARHARTIAAYEGFDAHANAVSERRTRILES